MNDLSEETLPLFLDETFAYYDDERLQNILVFLLYSGIKMRILPISNFRNNFIQKQSPVSLQAHYDGLPPYGNVGDGDKIKEYLKKKMGNM